MRNIYSANNTFLNTDYRFLKVPPSSVGTHLSSLANFLSERLSVDQSMILCFGRHRAKQYIHGNPIKNRILGCRLGYVIKFYLGAGSKDNELVAQLYTLTKDTNATRQHLSHYIRQSFYKPTVAAPWLLIMEWLASCNPCWRSPAEKIRDLEKGTTWIMRCCVGQEI